MKFPISSRFILVLAFTTSAFAAVTLAPLFRDGAVLQQGQPLAVWGRANPGENVQVVFRDQRATTAASADGRWRVTLPSQGVLREPAELVVTGTNTVRVRDVLVGDVWLCSGQSNMAWLVRNSDGAEQETTAARFPLIREFSVPRVVAEERADDVGGEWKRCTPDTVGDFSAVAYYFARDLHQRFGVPIGIVNSSWGGTQIEGWISEPVLRLNPAAQEIYARWEERLANFPRMQAAHQETLAKLQEEEAAGKGAARRRPVAPEGPGSRWMPGGMFNAMIAPLVPYGFRGALWYQGENNAARHGEYAALFRDLIQNWRTEFGQPLPFYFVQLANFEARGGNTGDVWAYLREAQASALALPMTGMATTIDIGNPTDIHPRNKQEVGRRLALHARKQLYRENIESDGPVFWSARPAGAAMRVTLSNAAGLRLDPAQDDGRVSFEVAGADRIFVAATAEIDGTTLLVSAPTVPEPVAVRYAWRNSPDARLFNSDDLPAAPFRSDRWEAW
jgi:sialate O-acetylesterase